LEYYKENRQWLARLAVWVDCDGERRPSSGFILATLAVLEPHLSQLLPLIVDLSNNPDRIVMALGLNFNPDRLLENHKQDPETAVKYLPAASSSQLDPSTRGKARVYAEMDEFCQGARGGELPEV
jgi:hypothetical protein